MDRPTAEAAPSVITERRHVIPPAVLAQRMHRYSIYLMVMAFLVMAVNMASLSLEAVLWFASGLAAAFALLCAISVIILNAIAWNFDRMKEEIRGGRQSTDLR